MTKTLRYLMTPEGSNLCRILLMKVQRFFVQPKYVAAFYALKYCIFGSY